MGTLKRLTLMAVAIAALNQPAQAQTVAAADVNVLAGTGYPGVADGPALQASFLMPSALAFGDDGTLYVADAAAQGIRAITPAGYVRTIAGSAELRPGTLSVPGGFRDGPASGALFNHPSGLAIRGGGIYVADTFNHCVRLIRGGVVSTIAGRCGELGFVDGAGNVNRLRYPRGLAFCGDLLYVADQRNGLRILDPNGNLSTLHLPLNLTVAPITGVACAVAGNDDYLYLTVKDRIIRYDLRSQTALVAFNPSPPLSMNSVQGGAPLGHAYSVAVLSPEALVYGDLLDGSVRYVEDFAPGGAVAQPYPQYVGGTPPEDAPLGLRSQAFSGPMGIAVDRSGRRIAIADAIQRKVYLVDLREQRHSFQQQPGVATHDEYRIVIEGNYLLWYATGFADSIAGLLEQRLRGHLVNGKRVSVVPLHVPCPDPRSATLAGADFVIFLLNSYVADCDGVSRFQRNLLLTQSPGEWQGVVRRILAPVSTALANQHRDALGVLMPFAWEVAPNENSYRTEAIGYAPAMTSRKFAFTSDYVSSEANLLRALDATGFPILDLYPVFRNAERRAHSATLFATEDLQPSSLGREAIAGAVADYLRKKLLSNP